MNKELKPCPFCGGKPQYDKSYIIRCHDCGAEVIEESVDKNVKDKWNKRKEE